MPAGSTPTTEVTLVVADLRLRLDARAVGIDPAERQLTVTSPDQATDVLDYVDLVLVVVGVRPDTELLTAAGAPTGPRGGRRRHHGHRPPAHLGRR